MNVKCLEAYQEYTAMRLPFSLDLLHTACPALGENPTSDVTGSCSARHIEGTLHQ